MPDDIEAYPERVLALNALGNIAHRLRRMGHQRHGDELTDIAHDIEYHLEKLGWVDTPPWRTSQAPTGDRD